MEGPALPADGFPMAYPPSCHQDLGLGAFWLIVAVCPLHSVVHIFGWIFRSPAPILNTKLQQTKSVAGAGILIQLAYPVKVSLLICFFAPAVYVWAGL